MRLLDIPPELFGGDACKEGHIMVNGTQVAKGTGIAKYLDAHSLAMLACVNREFREAAKTMKADLPQTLALHLVRLTPQMRALTAKSLFHNLGRGNEWEGSEAEKAMQTVETTEELEEAAEVMLNGAFEAEEGLSIWEWEDHLPECAVVICDVDATEKELFEALKTDARTHPFWDTFAEKNKEDRWHQIPDPSYIHIMHCEALQIYPEPLVRKWRYPATLTMYLDEAIQIAEGQPRCLWAPGHPSRRAWGAASITGSLWCGKIDVENAEVDGGWGVLTGPDNQWWSPPDASGFWRVMERAQYWD